MDFASTLLKALTSDWLWIAVGAIGAIIALGFTYREIKRTEMRAGSDFLLRLVEKFDSDEMQKKRSEIAKIWARSSKDYEQMEENKDVLDFFEDLGVLLRMKVIPKRLVWSDFCYWVLPYWKAFEGYVISWARGPPENDHTYYIEFQYLYEQIFAYDQWMQNSSALGKLFRRKKDTKITDEQVEDVMKSEMALC